METKKTIYSRILSAQAEIPKIEKDAVNPHFRSKFASLPSILEVVLPLLRKHGLLFTCQSVLRDDKPILEVALIDVETSEKHISIVPMIGITDMQKIGQAFTYGERYALLGLLGLSPDIDNDGEDLMNRNQQKETPIIKNVVVPQIIPANITKDRKEISVEIENLVKRKNAITKEEIDKYCLIVKGLSEGNKNITDEQLVTRLFWLKTLTDKK